MNDDDQFEQFLLPVEGGKVENDEMISGGVLPVDSPTRRLGTILNVQNPKIPESPDMKFARKRLGNLLTNIKHLPSDAANQINDESLMDEPEKRPPGRPRKIMRTEDPSDYGNAYDNKTANNQYICFELRGKPFGMLDGRMDSEYQLARAWMRGKLNPEEPMSNSKRQEFAPNLPVEYLACREITAMPKPMATPNDDLPIVPLEKDEFDKTVNPLDKQAIIAEYTRHWKAVKKGWITHQRKREAKYSRSVELLTKIYNPQVIY
ncbi:unnamed protein product [Caenorhabditis bovis]|uniref:Uncharacterized protein n=1 Tax=Caenorhabditis bovis TaxID=2654633 RepID=A0A8S1ERP4_9PELO|nr:unnamed protein product [Caenorhabditis bovis]